ncbi:hypothetical protein CJU90_5344 [Yarrowia sp. C11]|nr:hypothetical protein CJU90_5344 [Yarrowia sp. C11]KAG5363947.1 hypothetical protein CKK34_2723 [Yarrowia sp. E02]
MSDQDSDSDASPRPVHSRVSDQESNPDPDDSDHQSEQPEGTPPVASPHDSEDEAGESDQGDQERQPSNEPSNTKDSRPEKMDTEKSDLQDSPSAETSSSNQASKGKEAASDGAEEEQVDQPKPKPKTKITAKTRAKTATPTAPDFFAKAASRAPKKATEKVSKPAPSKSGLSDTNKPKEAVRGNSAGMLAKRVPEPKEPVRGDEIEMVKAVDKPAPAEKKTRKSVTKPLTASKGSVNYDDGAEIKGEITPSQENAITSYIKGEMMDVYKQVMEKAPLHNDPRNMLIRTGPRFTELRNAVFLRMKFMTSSIVIKEPQWRSWIAAKFSDIHSARKTLLNMFTRCLIDKKDGSVSKPKISKYFENVKIGVEDRSYGTNQFYDHFKRRLDSISMYYPIIQLIEKYDCNDDDNYDKVTRYFGPESLIPLTRAKFWDNFKTMEELIEYIDEAPDQICPYDDEMMIEHSALNVKMDLFAALLKIQTDALLKKFGYLKYKREGGCPNHLRLGRYLKDLRKLYNEDDITISYRRAITERKAKYSSAVGADNSLFLQWIDDLAGIQPDGSLDDEDADYFKRTHKRFALNVQDLPRLSDPVTQHPIINADKLREAIQKAIDWKDSILPDETGEQPEPERQSVERRSVNKVEKRSTTQGVKRDHATMSQSGKKPCALCLLINQGKNPTDFQHPWKECDLFWRLGFRRLNKNTEWGPAVEEMIKNNTLMKTLIKIGEFKKEDRERYNANRKKFKEDTSKAPPDNPKPTEE